MAYDLHAAVDADVVEWNETMWLAFNAPDMIISMVYPNGWSDRLDRRLRDAFSKSIAAPREKIMLTLARDHNTQQVVGIAMWSIEATTRDLDQVRADQQESIERRKQYPFIEGSNQALGDAFFQAGLASSLQYVGGQPHVELSTLAVRPEYQGKGVGRLLLVNGLEEADKLGLPVFLDASGAGKTLYEKHGFKVLSPLAFDGRDYGGKDEGKHWVMLRPAKQ